MTFSHALTIAAEILMVLIIAGGLSTAVCSLGLLAALKIRRVWYRWRVASEMSAVDRLSLESLAKYRREE
jgi:hypothetical protein